jgi:ParB family chromosome partitioning protein
MSTKNQFSPTIKAPAKRNVLGRGLASLMSSTVAPAVAVTPPPIQENAPTNSSIEERPEAININEKVISVDFGKKENTGSELIYVALDKCVRNEQQPRKEFKEDELLALSNSIRETGLLQPIVVRKLEGGDKAIEESFQIVAGERRWRAAKRAGLTVIPAILREITDKEAFQLAIIENVQRSDLNPIEEALAYERLISEFNETQNSIAQSIGKDRVSIANTIRLLKLDPEVRELVATGKLTAGHGRALLMTEDTAKQRLLARTIMEGSLSVRAAEKMLSGKLVAPEITDKSESTGNKHTSTEKSPLEHELEERLRRTLGTKLSLSLNTKGGGELRVNFFSRDEIDNFLEKVGA